MITNSVVVWICSLCVFTFSLIDGIKVAIDYQTLQHETESSAIEIARSFAVNPDISVRGICSSLKLPQGSKLESCEITQESVHLGVSKRVLVLAKPFEILAEADIGYGFYSQNGP